MGNGGGITGRVPGEDGAGADGVGAIGAGGEGAGGAAGVVGGCGVGGDAGEAWRHWWLRGRRRRRWGSRCSNPSRRSRTSGRGGGEPRRAMKSRRWAAAGGRTAVDGRSRVRRHARTMGGGTRGRRKGGRGRRCEDGDGSAVTDDGRRNGWGNWIRDGRRRRHRGSAPKRKASTGGDRLAAMDP